MKRALVLVLLLACAAARAQAEAGQPVRSLHYGDVLFQFFQERWFPAITSLMVSQHFERLAPQADDAELLRGGLLLSYGQHQEAGAIFGRLTDSPAAQRDRAWLMLARARWQRGLRPEAEAALARIQGAALTPELRDERTLLQAQLQLARGLPSAAADQLQPLVGRPEAGPYARFNRGVALLRSGDAAAGRAEFEALGSTAAATEERRVLRDRANLALGLEALRAQDLEPARAALQRVRLHGTASNPALLAYGWAAMQLGRPRDALVPWLELAARDASDPAVLEARLALPQAYAELGARREAIDRYEAALQAFEAERQALAATAAALRDGSALPALVQASEAHDLGRLGRTDLPALPHAAQLAPVLAEHEFQQAWTRWRDLQWLHANLRDWQAVLGAFDDMLALRRAAYEQHLPPVLAAAHHEATGLAALQARQQVLAGALAQADAEGDGVALASDAELALLQRLRGVQAALRALDADPAVPALAERARRVAGALGWQLALAAPQRRWDQTKALAELERLLGAARLRQAALDAAQQAEPRRFEHLGARIGALAERVLHWQGPVLALAQEQGQALAAIAVAVLERQQDRLAQHIAQARFALAQLQDGAELAQGDVHAQP